MRYSVIIAIAAIVTSCGSGQRIDKACKACFPEGEPGAAVLVMKGDKVIFDRGYGLADLETGVRIDGNTMFNIASISKQFTAVAVLQLVAEGKIALEDPLSKYFPEYADPLWNKVRIRHLLSHSSGIPDLRGGMPRERKVTADESIALEYLDTLHFLRFEPGTAYEYINPTFVLLGRLVERMTGMSFPEYAESRILRPSGMEKSLYFSPEREIPDMAHGYEYADTDDMPEERTAGTQEGPKDWYEYDYGEETFFATRPDGGLYASAHELVEWEKAIRKTLEGTMNLGIPADLLREAMSPHTEVSGSPWSDYQNRPDTFYGYGWFIEGKWIYHTGDNGGFKALLARKDDILIVILANRADWDRYALWKEIEKALQTK